MHILETFVTDEEEEIRKLNIPSATVVWSGPYSFKEAASKSGGGLYVIVKKNRTPLYVGQTQKYKSRFRIRTEILRQVACDLSLRQVYLGSIQLPKGGVNNSKLRLDLESAIIRSYLKRGQKLTNRSSVLAFIMGPKDALINNRGTLPPQMKRQIVLKRNERFELEFDNAADELFEDAFDQFAEFALEMFEAEEDELRRRRNLRRRKSASGMLRPYPSGDHNEESELEEEFRVSSLPLKVRQAFNAGALAWVLAVQEGIKSGMDLDVLTNIAFFMHHPERIQNGRGRALDSKEPQYIKLSKEWKSFRNLIKPMLDYPTKAIKPSSPKKSDLIQLLKKVSINSLSRNSVERLQLQRLQIFLGRALVGERVDDRYWQFSILDGFGRERNCRWTGGILGVKRARRPQQALVNFKRNCATAHSVEEVGRCLKNIHDAVLCHINALLGWANQMRGETRLNNSPECAWLLELQVASVRMAPRSIYSCFAPHFRNVWKVCK